MSTTTPAGEVAGEQAEPTFYDRMLATLDQRRAELEPDEASFFNRPMGDQELVEYLSFQAYYELRAAQFIGGWLADTPERDAFVLLAQQVEDEANHHEYCMRALARRGVTSLDRWKPEPEWEEWIDDWYPSGADTIERVAAHNLTGELGACQAFLEIKPRLPPDVQKTFDRIIPDEQFHLKLGRQVIEKYCVTEDDCARVEARVLHTFELEQAGRLAYNRRMAALGIADLDDPTPPFRVTGGDGHLPPPAEAPDAPMVPAAPVVPVIDLAAPTDAVAAAIDAAATHVGFFQIVGHGVDPTLVAAALGAMDELFALPLATRMATVPPSPEVNRGYAPSQSEALGYSAGMDTPPDLLEAFIVGPERPDLDDPAVLAQRDGVFAPNRWPVVDGSTPDTVRAPIVAYFDAVSALARRLTVLFAVALGLPADFFADKNDHATETMRLNHYDRGPGDPAPLLGQGWLGAHTDYGIVTVLHADAVPGLELLTLDGAWEGVIAEPGAFIVNLGDLLAEWTNDRWRSTIHRVVPPPAGGASRRRSIAFFLDGNHDALVECLPTCVSAANPARYPPILAGDHLLAKVLSGRTRSSTHREGLADPVGDRLTSTP